METSIEALAQRRCSPQSGAAGGLSVGEVQQLLGLLPGWALSDDGKTISKDFPFKNFYRTMAFVNAIAWIANREDHHPDMEVGYAHCLVRYSSHDVGGLSITPSIGAATVVGLL